MFIRNTAIHKTNPSLYGVTLGGVVAAESPLLADFVPENIVHYLQHGLSMLQAFSAFSPSINSSFQTIRTKVQNIRDRGLGLGGIV